MPRRDLDDFEEDLIELERASAILHQRDPDQAAEVVAAVRAREREEEERRARVEAARVAAARRTRVRRMRLAIVGGVLLVGGLAAIPVTQAVMREAERAQRLQEALAAVGVSVEKRGMKQEKEWLDVPPAGLVFEVPRNSCTALVAAGEGAQPLQLHLERHAFPPIEGAGALLWCSCEKEDARVRFANPPEQRVAIRMYSSVMSGVGGVEALMAEPPKGFAVVGVSEAMPCSDAAFAVWSRRETTGELDPFQPEDLKKARAALHENLEPVGVFRSDRMFGVVRSQPGHCYLAVPQTENAGLTFRDPEGLRLVEGTKTAVAWCTYEGDRAYAFWRKQRGTGDVLILRARTNGVGGLTGMREVGSRVYSLGVEGFLPNASLTNDAVAALVGSGLSEGEVVRAEEIGLPGGEASRVVAFSLMKGGSYLPDVAPRVPTRCVPNPPMRLPLRTYVCVQARPQKWRGEGAVDARGAAEGKLPFWLSLYASSTEDAALEAAARMLAFSRRMSLLGFEPTTVEGVKDTASGAQINGRPDHPLNVAVGLTTRPPYIHPLTDGPPWTLDGSLRIIEVKAGQSKQVRAQAGLGADPSSRRVVVWRK